MSAAADDKPCPVCQSPSSLTRHCLSTTCNWWRCRTRSCEAVLDFKRKRGHRLDPAAKGGRRDVTFLPGGEIA